VKPQGCETSFCIIVNSSNTATGSHIEENETSTDNTTTHTNGPLLGPLQPHNISPSSERHLISGNSSPLSISRGLIHDLTLPPGSPDLTARTKLSHFLSLKNQGVHFNEKLSASSSLKNPSLLVKLRQHAGIEDREQYAASLPPDVWNVLSLPDWAYREELLKTQQAVRLKFEERKVAGKRDTVEFVPSNSHDRRKTSNRKEIQ
jgi:hypothetical protein